MSDVKSHLYSSQQVINDVLFDSIGDGAVTTDEFGKITRINPTAEAIVGFSAKEAIGVWLPKLYAPFDDTGRQLPITERPMTHAFVTGQAISDHVNYRHKDGHLVRVALTVSPIMEGEKLVGSIQIFRDISTEYEIDKMKSDFISLASHQLRTPLSSVKTYSHMLLDGYMGQLNKPQIKALKTIISAANRMNETVSTLLNISRIESGKVIAERKLISVHKLFESVVEEHSLIASEKSINFKVNYPPTKVRLYSDSSVLKEVLGNLISNAIKYTPQSGMIVLSAKVPKKGNRLIVSVSDTGVGIPQESHSNIFSKFYRAENVIRQETSGIGLGLYLVKGLMDELGGKVWFKSEEDKGTIFYLSLPLRSRQRTKDISSGKIKSGTGRVRKTTAKSRIGVT